MSNKSNDVIYYLKQAILTLKVLQKDCIEGLSNWYELENEINAIQAAINILEKIQFEMSDL